MSNLTNAEELPIPPSDLDLDIDVSAPGLSSVVMRMITEVVMVTDEAVLLKQSLIREITIVSIFGVGLVTIEEEAFAPLDMTANLAVMLETVSDSQIPEILPEGCKLPKRDIGMVELQSDYYFSHGSQFSWTPPSHIVAAGTGLSGGYFISRLLYYRADNHDAVAESQEFRPDDSDIDIEEGGNVGNMPVSASSSCGAYRAEIAAEHYDSTCYGYDAYGDGTPTGMNSSGRMRYVTPPLTMMGLMCAIASDVAAGNSPDVPLSGMWYWKVDPFPYDGWFWDNAPVCPLPSPFGIPSRWMLNHLADWFVRDITCGSLERVMKVESGWLGASPTGQYAGSGSACDHKTETVITRTPKKGNPTPISIALALGAAVAVGGMGFANFMATTVVAGGEIVKIGGEEVEIMTE